MINRYTDYTAEVLYSKYKNQGTDRASIAARALERLEMVRNQKPKRSKVTKMRARK